jgi:hypothetical protein
MSEPPRHEVVSAVVSFYSSELSSHAGMLVGFVVGLFTLFQSREVILNAGIPLAIFELLGFLIIWAGVYSVTRIVYYGTLAGFLMNCKVETWRLFLSQERGEHLPHAQIANFAFWALSRDSRLHGTRRVMYGFWRRMLLSFVISMALSVAMLGWWVIPK